MVNKRIKKQNLDFKKAKLERLKNLHSTLKDSFSNPMLLLKNDIFNQYVDSIKLIPSFQFFGLSKYYLYIKPTNIGEVDFKLLLLNTFEEIQFPAYIDRTHSFFISYIFPYRKPNISYINWLTKSKKEIREYCLFFIKKVYYNLHFDFNLTPNGWDLDPNYFKSFAQKILFDRSFHHRADFRSFNITELKSTHRYGFDSEEFQDLMKIYDNNKLTISLNELREKPSELDLIGDFTNKNLIFPYFALKNLDLQEEIHIILPSLKKDDVRTLLMIFSFFNVAIIYEIEGNFFIDGQLNEHYFEKGLYIKLFLPKLDLSLLKRVFDDIFQFFNISKYLILADLVEGKEILSSVFGNINFLNEYNPLKNLIWKRKDGKWLNHKLFTEKFEKIYPDLDYGNSK